MNISEHDKRRYRWIPPFCLEIVVVVLLVVLLLILLVVLCVLVVLVLVVVLLIVLVVVLIVLFVIHGDSPVKNIFEPQFIYIMPQSPLIIY